MLQTKKIFGLDFICGKDYEEILTCLFESQSSPKSRLLITPNVDQLVKIYKAENRSLLDQAKKADFVLPDGQPIVWFSKFFTEQKLKKRLTGSDFFPRFMAEVKKREPSLHFILPNEKTADALKADYSQLSYNVAPLFNVSKPESFADFIETVISSLEKKKPAFILIGLGFPKQEMLAKLIRGKLNFNHNILLLGASFEYYTKTKKRAPIWMRKIGIEFIYRFLSEPGRMFKRYFIDDLSFISLCWKQLRGKL